MVLHCCIGLHYMIKIICLSGKTFNPWNSWFRILNSKIESLDKLLLCFVRTVGVVWPDLTDKPVSTAKNRNTELSHVKSPSVFWLWQQNCVFLSPRDPSLIVKRQLRSFRLVQTTSPNPYFFISRSRKFLFLYLFFIENLLFANPINASALKSPITSVCS